MFEGPNVWSSVGHPTLTGVSPRCPGKWISPRRFLGSTFPQDNNLTFKCITKSLALFHSLQWMNEWMNEWMNVVLQRQWNHMHNPLHHCRMYHFWVLMFNAVKTDKVWHFFCHFTRRKISCLCLACLGRNPIIHLQDLTTLIFLCFHQKMSEEIRSEVQKSRRAVQLSMTYSIFSKGVFK